TPKLAQVVFGESNNVQIQVTERLINLLFVENTNNRVLAMNRRHDGNTEVHISSFVPDTKTSVLWDPTFSDVEFRHNFDTRDQRLMISEINRINFGIECAVDSILHLHFGVASFDMNIGSTRLHGVVNNRIDEFDDWRHFGIGCQSIQIEYFFAVLSFANE